MLKALCATTIELPTGVPDWIKVLPVARGQFAARDGRTWRIGDAAKVVATSLSAASGIEPVVDYEHQTDYSKENGKAAPAAGWIKQLEARDDGIYGRVEWTARARRYLENREYRYVSPTFTHTKAGDVLAILRVALTNDPALSDLPALAKKENDVAMDETLKKLLEAMGIDPADFDEQKALAKVAELKKAADGPKPKRPGDTGEVDQDAEHLKAMATALGVENAEVATLGDVAKALASVQKAGPAKPATGEKASAIELDPTQFVSKASFDEVSAALKSLQDERDEEKALAAVDEGMRAGKVTPAQKDWAIAYAKKDPAGFTVYLSNAPVLASAEPALRGQPAKATGPLTAEEKSMCHQLGISEDDFKKARDEENA